MLNFNFLAWIEVCQELPHHHYWLGGHWGFLIRNIDDMGHPWPHNCSWHWIPNMYAKVHHSSMIRSVSRTSLSLMGVLGRHWWFLTGELEDRVTLVTMDHLGGPQRTYPESLVSLSLFLADIWGCVTHHGNKNITNPQSNRQRLLKFI